MSGMNYLGKTDTDFSLATKQLFDSRVNGYLTQDELNARVADGFTEKALIEYVTSQDNRAVRRSYFDQILSRKIPKNGVGRGGGIAPLTNGKVPLKHLKNGPRMPYGWGGPPINFAPAQVTATGPVQLTSFVVRHPGYLYFPFFFGSFAIFGLGSDTSAGVGGSIFKTLLADVLESAIRAGTSGTVDVDLDTILSANILPGYLNITVRIDSMVGTVLANGVTDVYLSSYSGVRSGTIVPSTNMANGITPFGYDRDLQCVLVAHAPSQGSNMLISSGQASCLLFPVFVS